MIENELPPDRSRKREQKGCRRSELGREQKEQKRECGELGRELGRDVEQEE
jgi:hypothetical protein